LMVCDHPTSNWIESILNMIYHSLDLCYMRCTSLKSFRYAMTDTIMCVHYYINFEMKILIVNSIPKACSCKHTWIMLPSVSD
jgi:hypothetical protein